MYPNDNYFASLAVGKAPEHLMEKQRDTLDGISRGNSRYYRVYEIKETLQLILRCTDRDETDRKKTFVTVRIPAMSPIMSPIMSSKMSPKTDRQIRRIQD